MNFMTGSPPAPSNAAEPSGARRPRADFVRRVWVVAGVLGFALLWSFWTTLGTMVERWWTDPQYSHGFLVPLFAGAVLWFRRDLLKSVTWEPDYLGLPILAAGLIMHVSAGRIDVQALDSFSLLPTLAGAILFVGGRRLFLWSWPAVAFLAFMLPLPFTIEVALAQPLRRLATVWSTYLLQTFGYPALYEGNIIIIDQLRMGVVEACSGLGMLMTFFALATAFVFVIDAPRTDRIVLLVSAIPIAVVANVLRITITGMAFYATGSEAVQKTMHDMAGWLMMPLALGMFWGELWFLGRLLKPGVKVEPPKPLPLLSGPSSAASGPMGPSLAIKEKTASNPSA